MLVGLLCVITGGINSSTKVHSFVGYVTLQYIPHTKQHIISHLTSRLTYNWHGEENEILIWGGGAGGGGGVRTMSFLKP